MSPGLAGSPRDRFTIAARAAFAALLLTHLGFCFVGWSHGLLPGQEFRQTQTALSTLFIQRENNFSLSYPTPILGKPWSVPMEFPLYQWSVVGVSNLTKLPLAPAARLVSLLCFYLTFPALLLLLRRMGVPAGHRWIAVSVVLLGPVYVFYSRAFMIESMALMSAVWFTAAFLEAMDSQRTRWLIVANLAGIVASTVKITTFVPYLIAAIAAGLFHLHRAWPKPGESWQAVRRAAARIVGCMLPTLIASVMWLSYSDNVKRQNVSADFLVSSALSSYNFGSWSLRFSGKFWQELIAHWSEGLVPLVVTIIASVAGLIFGGRHRRLMAGLLALFLGAQLIFAQLYLIHIYYFYANGVLLLLAVGLALVVLFERLARFPVIRHLPWAVLAVLAFTQYQAYRDRYLALQQLDTGGGGEHTKLLEQLTAPDDVIIVVGDDWSSIIPYYAGRRALMIPVWREQDDAYLTKAFAALRGVRVGAVIISRSSRSASRILDQAEREFQTLPVPAFTFRDDLVFYFHQDLQARVTELLHGATAARYATLDIPLPHETEPARYTWNEISVAPLADKSAFAAMSPLPELLRTPFDRPMSTTVANLRRLNAHAPSEIIYALPSGSHTLTADYGLAEESYTQTDGTGTDGVQFTVIVRRPHRADRTIAQYSLAPRQHAADQGTHSTHLKFEVPPGSELVLQTTPGPSNDTAFDWAYWGKVVLR